MRDITSYMDPFFGNGTIDLPRPEGIAATWFFIKAQSGNTYPGACAPFGMVSICPYSGAYPTGYGVNAPNTHATPPRAPFLEPGEDFVASGFTHFQQSGTGAIETYYNYVRVTPLLEGKPTASTLERLEGLGTRWALEDEEARPGYYAATLAGTGIRAELTASARAAFHRYTFEQGGRACIVVDVSTGGLDFPRMRTVPMQAELAVAPPRAAQGHVWMEGLPLYMYVEVDLKSAAGALWLDKQVLPGQQTLSLPEITEEDCVPFGVVFEADVNPGTIVHTRLGFSLRSIEQARANVQEVQGRTFAQVVKATREQWRAHAERIHVVGGTEAQRTTFYSSLYHSLLKPANWRDESPYWEDAPFCVDFATMWDQYKTQLPLILTLYPEHGRDVINSLLALGEYVGGFPNGFVLNANLAQFDNQARALAHYTIADAYYRHLEGVDWRRALRVMLNDLRQARNEDFLQQGIAYPVTHTLDLAGACFCTAQLAQGLGEDAVYDEIMALAKRWVNAYDPDTGRLIEARYYEGGLWNYSFRLLHDMAGRIALCPAEPGQTHAETFVADLDRFFGYGQPPIVQPTDPADRETMRQGYALNRFEGYNNEPDIETPYTYIYAGRHDRTAEVVRAGMRYMFTTGRGGLPGNNDSGGLTSCYVWNAIGLFPVTGQPLFLIGSPLFDAVSLQVGGEVFTVKAANNSDVNIYVQEAALNGQPLNRAYLTVDEVVAGGTLALTMGSMPSGWASDHLPPSYREE